MNRLKKYAIVGCLLTLPLYAQQSFNGETAFKYLEDQVVLGPRHVNSDGAQLAIDYFESFFEIYAHDVVLQRFRLPDPYGTDTLHLTNIIARINPDQKKRIMLGAHWDSRPRADMDVSRKDEPILGANDGASGVAVLMHISEILMQTPPRVGVDILLFDGEDYGKSGDPIYYLLGSRHYANNPTFPLGETFLLLDMIGDADLNIKIEVNSYRSAPKVVQSIWAIASELHYPQFIGRYGQSILDDHIPFIEKGIPSVDLIDFSYGPDGENYWHTHNDTPDKCSPESLKIVGDVVLTWIYRQ
jgi:glutaminyl-peptide cyclotransferase